MLFFFFLLKFLFQTCCAMPFFNDHGAATHGNLCYCFDVCVCVCFRLQCIEHARFTLAKVGEGKKKKSFEHGQLSGANQNSLQPHLYSQRELRNSRPRTVQAEHEISDKQKKLRSGIIRARTMPIKRNPFKRKKGGRLKVRCHPLVIWCQLKSGTHCAIRNLDSRISFHSPILVYF